MTSIVCNTCKQEVDVENSGDSVECSCGAMVKSDQSVEATKSCPSCSTESPVAAIVCTECGYNFQTGDETRAETDLEEEDDELSFFYRYKPLIKIGVALVILGLAAVVYLVETGTHFGISNNTPIGTQEKVEEYLLKIGMVKDEDPYNALVRTGMDGTCITYKDRLLFQGTKGMFDQSVHIILDKDGQLNAICGKFHSDDMGPKGGRTHGFLRTLWVDLGGDPKTMTIANDLVHAKWTRTTMILGVLELNDETVGVSLKGSPYERVVDTFCAKAEEPVIPGAGL